MKFPKYFLISFLTISTILITNINQSFANPEEPEQCDSNSAIKDIESAGSGGYNAINRATNAYGAYQMREDALIDAGYAVKDGSMNDGNISWTGVNGINSTSAFLASQSAQEDAYAKWVEKSVSYTAADLAKSGDNISNYLGKTLPCGATITESSIAAAQQLGHVRATSYLKNGFQCDSSTEDQSGTCVQKYMCNAAACTPFKKDMSKKTCDVVMPMIKAISCDNFSGETKTFCEQYKPYLMTDEECNSAEEMSKAAKKGKNQDRCENMTFGPQGTGSWSFELACSYARKVDADQDGAQNSNTAQGLSSDPECIQNLKARGVSFDILGDVNNGSYNGTSCIIQNAVAVRGRIIPYPGRTTLNCDMALAMDKFDEKVSAVGVTAYEEFGAIRACSGYIGPAAGTGVTKHAMGRAVDIGYIVVNGKSISMDNVLNPETPDGAIAYNVYKNIACNTFTQVLSSYFYKKAFHHFHLEWSDTHNCH